MNILFWSGGKDSYFAWHFFKEARPSADITLLTTYNKSTQTVPHQQIPISEIEKQAKHLNSELISIALPPEPSNETYLKAVQESLEKIENVENLVFGDWYVQDIRQWREKVFGDMGYTCSFPIWEKDLNELLAVLLLQPVQVEISAVSEEYQSLLKVGESYDQRLVTQLQQLDDIDPMGEKGEFHTHVRFIEPNQPARQ